MEKINWFPGHMAKTIKQFKQILQSVDIVIELVDARIPFASRNPEIRNLLSDRHYHIVGLTKIDLADPDKTELFKQAFKGQCNTVIELNTPKKKGVGELLKLCKNASDRKRKNKPFYISKVMICGVPNVGKSALINQCTRKKAAQVQNKPGVTKQTKGVLLDKFLELIDSPGLLWPNLGDESIGKKLALCKMIKDSLYDDYTISEWLLDYLASEYPDAIKRRYQLPSLSDSAVSIIEQIGRSKGWLLPDNMVNENKVVRKIIEDFQSNKLGRISLDKFPA